LTEFLDALGSSAPTPGGGAGAAVALGMGAALVAMTARLTTGRRKFRAVQADMERVIERCDAIRDSALDLAEADAEAYGEVMAAFGLPRGSDNERSVRQAEISSACEQASRVPLRVAAAAAEVIELAAETAEKGNPNVISDAGAGAALRPARGDCRRRGLSGQRGRGLPQRRHHHRRRGMVDQCQMTHRQPGS